jgi:hypothetical protein
LVEKPLTFAYIDTPQGDRRMSVFAFASELAATRWSDIDLSVLE